MTDEKIARINALAKKAKAEGLTDKEKREQQTLREEYVADFRKSLKAQLDNTVVINPDGGGYKLKQEKGGGGCACRNTQRGRSAASKTPGSRHGRSAAVCATACAARSRTISTCVPRRVPRKCCAFSRGKGSLRPASVTEP